MNRQTQNARRPAGSPAAAFDRSNMPRKSGETATVARRAGQRHENAVSGILARFGDIRRDGQNRPKHDFSAHGATSALDTVRYHVDSTEHMITGVRYDNPTLTGQCAGVIRTQVPGRGDVPCESLMSLMADGRSL